MRVNTLIATCILLVSSFSTAPAADRGVGSIELSANPNVIAPDGKTTATITAEVRDRDGKLVPDGTEVRFTASLGIIEETGTTFAGVARVNLVSADIPGTSIVTASWVEGQAVAQSTVEFADVDVSVTRGPEYISVDADEYLAYSIDYKVLEALGNVRIRYRSLELEAHEAQVDLEKGRIIARGQGRDRPVELHTANGTVEGNMFACDLAGSRGLLLSAKTGSVLPVDASNSLPKIGDAEVPYMPEEFDITDLSDSSILVKAKRATVFPNEKIHFKAANVYVDGKRMLSLPLYVLSLTGYPLEGEQYVGYSTGGITLNLPLYYSLSPSSTGALLVRHGESTGWGEYGQRPGWFVDMRQKYSTSRSHGSLVLSQITGADWGAQFSHSQYLGNRTHGYLFLDYPAHEALYGALTLSKSLADLNIGLNLYGNKYQGAGRDSLAGSLYLRTRGKSLGNSSLKYTLSARLARSYSYTRLFEGSDAASSLIQQESSQSLEGNIYSAPIHLSKNLSLRTSAGLGYVWSDSSLTGLSSLGTAVLDWRLSRQSSFQLSYRFIDRPSVYTYRPVGQTPTSEQPLETRTLNRRRQTLSAMLHLTDGKKWRASAYAIKGLDYSATNLFANISYRLNPDWRLGVRSTLSDFGYSSYDDFEFELGKKIGNRELMAVWSKSQGRIMFELGSGGL